jgi:hypothetical protein
MCLCCVASLPWIVCVTIAVVLGDVFLLIDKEVLTYSALVEKL